MTEPGLRERKKLKTREAIRREAFRLFRDQGYAATTVEQIAAAVEISPSTFFNYFPNKDAVVLRDDYDPLLLAKYRDQPPEVSPVRALRNAMFEVFSGLSDEELAAERERQRLIMSEPELRAALLVEFADLIQQIAAPLAERVGRTPDDFRIRLAAGALIGVMMAVMVAAADDPMVDYLKLMDQGFDFLDKGLTL
ncbi:MAG: TetR family transcriptional regulator [Candidatus Dormibacteraceae bacterium]